MLTRIHNIWRKEIMDGTRDRRALTQSLLAPLIIGILIAGMNPLLSAAVTTRRGDPVTVPAQGIEYAGRELIDTLKEFEITLEPFAADLEGPIARGDEPAGLIIPKGFSERIANEQPASLTLLTNQTAGGLFGGSFSARRLDLAISIYNQRVSIERVEVRGINPDLLTPVALNTQDLATPEQLGGVFASLTLPLLVGIIVVLGGLFIAIDVTAGEKERGTLEALLVTPASDVEIFSGKLAAVFALTSVPLVLTFLSFWAASNLLPEAVTKGAVLPIQVILGAILVSLPLALFIDVVLMLIGIRTKTFKDAQSSATVAQFAIMVPVFAAVFVTPTSAMAFLIPIYGPAAVLGAIARGGTMPANAVSFGILGSLLAAAVVGVIAMWLFNRERLVYGG